MDRQRGATPDYGERLFIIYSASACWGPEYKLGMLTFTGDDVLDPAAWTKHPEPVFEKSEENGVFGPGHNSFFKSPDGTEDWILYHANDSPEGVCDNRRTTRAQPFTWNEDGTPNFGVPVSLDTELPVPSASRQRHDAAPPVSESEHPGGRGSAGRPSARPGARPGANARAV